LAYQSNRQPRQPQRQQKALEMVLYGSGDHRLAIWRPRGHGFDGCLYDVVVLMFRACGVKSVILLVVAHFILLDLESFLRAA
jgi:hypothetical protein